MEINLRYILSSSGRRSCEESVLQDYLSTIYRLESVYGVAKTSKIAEELNVTPATVTKMVRKMEKAGLVKYDKYRGTNLTERGKKIAVKVVWKHRVCECFLRDVLKMDMYRAHIYAHAMEHLPDEIVMRIYDITGRPLYCPHGNPIADLERLAKRGEILARCARPGASYRVVRILGEFSKVLKIFHKWGISMNSILKVIEVKNSRIITETENGNNIELSKEYAELIEVEIA
ncbi:MAG: metal-dependent transcriptional regulator [Crenarchaeota archaeon]|nr:metal-dependent transcriptional regulator [Thermoproteota archaeon]